ncbi:MAG: D-alanyl-D-alanine carboxypeptidase family protein [Lachnospiraceae bacterium]
MKKNKNYLFFFLLFFFVVTNHTLCYANEETNINLYAQSAVLMDADSGRILYSKNEEAFMANASTTKIVTCILALELGNLEDLVYISKNASRMPDVQLNANEGEYYYLKDLLYSLMLESHNDVAVAIAEHIGGDTIGFATLMNELAQKVGCENTFFVTPNGLDGVASVKTDTGEIVEQNHGTTAKDLSLLMRYCIMESPQKEMFLEITRMQSYTFSNYKKNEDETITKGTRTFSCSNKNAFLQMMAGALSGKTGFTNKAGYCYVGALERDDKTYIVALLACGWPNNRTYKWSDTKALMNYGIENYQKAYLNDLVLEESFFDPIIVKNGKTNHIGDIAYSNLLLEMKFSYESILLKEEDDLYFVYDKQEELVAPVLKGACIGSVKIMLNDEVLESFEVTSGDSIEEIDFYWCFFQVMENFLIFS